MDTSNKTSTAIKIGPKSASQIKITLAFGIDVLLLYTAVVFTFQYFPIEKILSEASPLLRYVYTGLYYYFFLTIVSQTIFSQTMGMFILGLKVVTKDKYKKLSFVQTLFYGIYLRFLSNSVVVSIR